MKNSLLFLFLIASIQTTVTLAQTKTRDVRLNVYAAQKTDQPQSVSLKNVEATLVELATNKLIKARIITGNPFFAGLSEGKYNAVAAAKGYVKSFKPFSLNCRIIDEKNIFDETVFLEKGDFTKSIETNASHLGVKPLVAPPAPPGGYPKNYKYNTEEITSDYLNDHAVFLPKPALSPDGEAYRKHIEKEKGFFSARIYVVGDESGNITDAFYTSDNGFDIKIFPDITEKAKQAKFTPFKLDGKPVGFSGVIFYFF